MAIILGFHIAYANLFKILRGLRITWAVYSQLPAHREYTAY